MVLAFGVFLRLLTLLMTRFDELPE